MLNEDKECIPSIFHKELMNELIHTFGCALLYFN